ncbi:hypothetical protein KCH_36110 [Kitasatospora cheerisanensis KCTC 2395]|uniref:Uncharacterized protein n=1 Tax=Kitasatospora cheerisanensis KCTC 2395 TaxID=1348663 RepID=A0A066YX08_9ACTN|nr:hypothetical protein KCH_36110 [Kitasatospora cheerisanensis KCTC 2395]
MDNPRRTSGVRRATPGERPGERRRGPAGAADPREVGPPVVCNADGPPGSPDPPDPGGRPGDQCHRRGDRRVSGSAR